MKWIKCSDPLGYSVSERGHLRLDVDKKTRKAGFRPRGSLNGGYLQYKISTGCEVKRYWAHRLVLEAFHGPQPTAKHVCAHWDANRLNNHYENLRWATPSENNADIARLGLNKGSKNPNAILDEVDVFEIKKLRERGLTLHDIASRYGVHYTTIGKITTGKNWSNYGG
jgi:hypothetical protein